MFGGQKKTEMLEKQMPVTVEAQQSIEEYFDETAGANQQSDDYLSKVQKLESVNIDTSNITDKIQEINSELNGVEGTIVDLLSQLDKKEEQLEKLNNDPTIRHQKSVGRVVDFNYNKLVEEIADLQQLIGVRWGIAYRFAKKGMQGLQKTTNLNKVVNDADLLIRTMEKFVDKNIELFEKQVTKLYEKTEKLIERDTTKDELTIQALEKQTKAIERLMKAIKGQKHEDEEEDIENNQESEENEPEVDPDKVFALLPEDKSWKRKSAIAKDLKVENIDKAVTELKTANKVVDNGANIKRA